MRIISWVIALSFWTVVAAFLHYTLPQRDIVWVQGTEIIRQDFSGFNRLFYAAADTGNNEATVNRDLRLINTTGANGRVRVYRNEDTGFGWPPYFKLDSSNLQAEAQGAVSSRATPEWYLLTHYGWRNEWLTIYPNAISLRPIAGPDVGKPIPWVNIFILTLLAATFWAIYVRWRRFREARIDPTLDAIDDGIAEKRAGFTRWLGTWRSKN
ncbi:MAG: DUF1523 family protein [Pseudomonadota bacterium]